MLPGAKQYRLLGGLLTTYGTEHRIAAIVNQRMVARARKYYFKQLGQPAATTPHDGTSAGPESAQPWYGHAATTVSATVGAPQSVQRCWLATLATHDDHPKKAIACHLLRCRTLSPPHHTSTPKSNPAVPDSTRQ
jgi:hypothetical protein